MNLMQEDVHKEALRVIQNSSKVFDRKGRAIDRSPSLNYNDSANSVVDKKNRNSESAYSVSPSKVI